MKKVGFTWLQEKFNIQGFRLTHESYIGTTSLEQTNEYAKYANPTGSEQIKTKASDF
ncbi:MAG: hypothetical protein ABFS35_20380 [Bacteroidota bacterium]